MPERLFELTEPEDDYQTEMKNALVGAMGWRLEDVTRSMWGQVEKAGAELRELGVQPAEVYRRARVYRVNRPHQTLSPAALVKWWPDCAEPRVGIDKSRIREAANREDVRRRLDRR